MPNISKTSYPSALLLMLLMTNGIFCQIPNVYEFCSALMNDNRPGHLCAQQCSNGNPGKRGPPGVVGPRGEKGVQGEEGTCETLENKLEATREALRMFLLASSDTLVHHCGLGMKSEKIPNSAITESEKWDGNYAGFKGRLDHGDAGAHAWVVRSNRIGHWIQVDLGRPTVVLGVVTQGRNRYSQWVKSFQLGCTNDTSTWPKIQQNGSEKVFLANTDKTTKVTNILPSAAICRYVRLYPLTWNGSISMRMELLGEQCASFFVL